MPLLFFWAMFLGENWELIESILKKYSIFTIIALAALIVFAILKNSQARTKIVRCEMNFQLASERREDLPNGRNILKTGQCLVST